MSIAAHSRGALLRAGADLVWRLVALVMVSAALVACSSSGVNRARTDAIEGLQIDYRKRALSVAMNEYALEFTSAVERAADTIAAETDSDVIRRRALMWKMYAIPQARIACFRLDPLAAQFDMWAFAMQMEAFFTTGEGASVFGDQQALAAAVSGSLLADIREIAQRFAETEDDLARIEAEQIRSWADANPIHSLSFQRSSSIGRFADLAREQGDAFAQFASIEEHLAQLLMMLRVYMADLPRQARWQAELILDQTLEQIGNERSIILESVEGSIAEVLATVQDERKNIAGDIDRIVAQSIEAAIAEGSAKADGIGERVVDMLTIRIVILIIVGVVLAPVVARIYMRVWPRSG